MGWEKTRIGGSVMDGHVVKRVEQLVELFLSLIEVLLRRVLQLFSSEHLPNAKLSLDFLVSLLVVLCVDGLKRLDELADVGVLLQGALRVKLPRVSRAIVLLLGRLQP